MIVFFVALPGMIVTVPVAGQYALGQMSCNTAPALGDGDERVVCLATAVVAAFCCRSCRRWWSRTVTCRIKWFWLRFGERASVAVGGPVASEGCRHCGRSGRLQKPTARTQFAHQLEKVGKTMAQRHPLTGRKAPAVRAARPPKAARTPLASC